MNRNYKQARPAQKRRKRLGAEVREEGLAAARKLLLAGGPAAVTLASVGAEIGMSHANVLHHFGSAAGLQSALMGSMINDLTGALDDVVEHRSALRVAYLKQLGTAAGLGYETAETDDTLAKLAVDAKLRREQDADRDVRFVFGLAAALLLLIDRLNLRRREFVRRGDDAGIPSLRTGHARG